MTPIQAARGRTVTAKASGKPEMFRTTCLDRWLFSSITEARVVINHWLEEYNKIRPHGALGGMNPKYFLQRWIEGNTDQQPETLTM